MKGTQSRVHTMRKLTMSRAELWPRESQTAVQNRDHNHMESSSFIENWDCIVFGRD